jgi:hypothetical protein
LPFGFCVEERISIISPNKDACSGKAFLQSIEIFARSGLVGGRVAWENGDTLFVCAYGKSLEKGFPADRSMFIA